VLTLFSPAFTETIPKRHTKDGLDLSPQLSWSAVPSVATSLALILEDPDAPGGLFTHWLVWNISPVRQGLPEGLVRVPVLEGMRQGRNDYGEIGYGGPAPPPGRVHRYRMRLFALREAIEVSPGAVRGVVEPSIFRSTLESAEAFATYSRS